jgi:DNA-binding response OmpR family regulator
MSQKKIEYKTLLLVEDEAITAMSEAAMLKRHGFNVIIAYSGEAAIQHVTSEPAIDLVLMDIDLGEGMDGTDAAGIILQKKNLPVVFLSSHTEKDIVEKTEGVSSYGYIVKNSGETVLIASIKMAFRLHKARMENERHKQEIEAANEELQGTIEELEATNEELIRSQQEIVERDNALRRSVHMLEESQRIAHLGHWDHDLVNDSIYWSDEMYRIFKVETQEFTATYEGFLRYVHPDDRDFVNAAYTSSVESRRPYDIVHRLLLPDIIRAPAFH